MSSQTIHLELVAAVLKNFFSFLTCTVAKIFLQKILILMKSLFGQNAKFLIDK